MTQLARVTLLTSVLGSLLCAPACGNSDAGSGSATGGTGGGAGGASGAGGDAGGSDLPHTGGTSGAAGAGGSVDDAGGTTGDAVAPDAAPQCSPRRSPKDFRHCSAADIEGEGHELPEPLLAGQPYAMMLQVHAGSFTAEIRGAESLCGDPGEVLLAPTPLGIGKYCFNLTAAKDWRFVMLTSRESKGGLVYSYGYCPGSQCTQ